MGVYTFTCWCIANRGRLGVDNPYNVNSGGSLEWLLYQPEYWTGVVYDREWAEAQYAG